MKRISLYWVGLAAAGLLAGCHPDPPATGEVPVPVRSSAPKVVKAVVDTARLREIKDSLAILAGAPDTFRASGGRVFRMRKISKAEYDAAGSPSPEHTLPADSTAAVAAEKDFLTTAAGRVWRAADTLFFRAGNGHVGWLHDGPTYQDADDSYEQYRYLANLPEIQQWLVEVGQWEGRHYLLIDQQTSQRTRLISYPVLSPDHQRFVCANSDPTGYSLDGLQLWQKPAGKPPRLLWQRLSNATQPGLAALVPRWQGPDTLFFYQDFISAGRYMELRVN
jgi:hypothetical protein